MYDKNTGRLMYEYDLRKQTFTERRQFLSGIKEILNLRDFKYNWDFENAVLHSA
jgi:hypothetical protein